LILVNTVPPAYAFGRPHFDRSATPPLPILPTVTILPDALASLQPHAALHLLLHFIVPGLVAAIWYPRHWARAWLVLLAGWLIDLDHLLADPVYAPGRCSIGFHPLHSIPAIALYGGLLIPRRTRLFGIGLLIHIALDAIDCMFM